MGRLLEVVKSILTWLDRLRVREGSPLKRTREEPAA